jgi:hypothetical protein
MAFFTGEGESVEVFPKVGVGFGHGGPLGGEVVEDQDPHAGGEGIEECG